MSKVLFFCPYCPAPPARGGDVQRVLAMLESLRRLGAHVTLLSSDLALDSGWTDAAVETLRQGWVDDVRVFRADAGDYLAVVRAHRRARTERRGHDVAGDAVGSVLSGVIVPDRFRSWFTVQREEVAPTVVWINHVQWDCLVDHDLAGAGTTVIDSHDLTSLNLKMRRALMPYLSHPPDGFAGCTDEALREDFFTTLGLTADVDELRMYDRYDHTIAISASEATAISAHTGETRVTHIPMTYASRPLDNSYGGPALLCLGAHPFNLQGYLYFVNRVLPLIRSQAPDFHLQVTGSWFRGMQPAPTDGVLFRGRVPDVTPLYAEAAFFLAPMLAGTGESVKIVEAMAHGLPVVAMAGNAAASPLRHGLNGFVAADASEMAGYSLRLWRDPDLRRRLGEAARETVAAERSDLHLDNWVRPLLSDGR